MRLVVINSNSHRAHNITDAVAEGITNCGDEVKIIHEREYCGVDDSVDGAIHYGLRDRTFDAFRQYRKQKFTIYIDMGYWGRHEGGPYNGYHKVAINDRHPTKYFQDRPKPPDRFEHFGYSIQPYRKKGQHILLAGMGHKAPGVEGFRIHQWEEAAVAEIKKHTDRHIIYRPKPSWGSPPNLDGTQMITSKEQTLDQALNDCWATVSHHSNVCVDGLIAGVPCFCFHGVASVMGQTDLSKIEEPLYPDNRKQWLSDIAYTQWHLGEMRSGLMWHHVKQELMFMRNK